jgi:MazG family protein
METQKNLNNTERLLGILATLRGENGCNWDKKQSFTSMAEHIKEESAEVCEALNTKDFLHIKEELGDLLMTIALTAQIAKEDGLFNFDEMAKGICEKLIHRHPHIFRDDLKNLPIKDIEALWEIQKSTEKAHKAKLSSQINEYLTFANPVIVSEKIQAIAAEVGFDFPSLEAAFQKIPEEVIEVEESLGNNEKLEEELGDLLFAAINVSRMAKVDMTRALQKANEKFARRFEIVEELAEGTGGFKGKTIEELDVYWNQAKKREA